MSPIEIIFTTPTQPWFRWLDSFKCLREEEIEILIVILRGALAAFSAELADRREPSRDQTLEKYKKMLQETAKQINEQGLTRTHKGYLGSLNESLAQAGHAQSKKGKAARQYLWLVSSVIGWPYVLLIYCALGKHKVELLNEDQQVQLVKYMAEHRESLFCCRLKDSAIQCQFQEKRMDFISITSCVLNYRRYQSRPATDTRLPKAEETRKHWWRYRYRKKRSTKREFGRYYDG